MKKIYLKNIYKCSHFAIRCTKKELMSKRIWGGDRVKRAVIVGVLKRSRKSCMIHKYFSGKTKTEKLI